MSTGPRRCVVIAAVALAASQALAALCGCIRREPPIVESAPTQHPAWADPAVLVQHHPLWNEYAQLRAAEEAGQGEPASGELRPPSLEGTHAVAPDTGSGPDLDEWRDSARRITRGPDRPARPPEEWVPAHAAEEADARLSADREKIGAVAEARVRQAERDVASARLSHSEGTRVDAMMTRLNAPPDDAKAAQKAAEIRGDPEEWARRQARDEEARIRAETAGNLRRAELEHDADVLRAAIDARSREPEVTYDAPSERKAVTEFVQPPAKPRPASPSLSTQRMARRERELADQATALRHSFAEAAERHRVTSRAQLDALYEQLIRDTRDMALSLAATRGIDLTFEPTEGRDDLTKMMADLLDQVYTAPADGASPEPEPTE